jgi:DNA ligase (NAD+)
MERTEYMTITDAQRIVALRTELTDHAYRYYIANSPFISDDEYDLKFKQLVEMENQHPEMFDPNSPTQRVGSPIPGEQRKMHHRVRMLSLDNTNSLDEAMDFLSGQEGREVTLEMKIDGLSLHLDYEKGRLVRAITRGDGSDGQDVTENARTIHTLPLVLRRPVDISVRGEVYWSLTQFEKYNTTVAEGDRFANPRNGASGSLQLKDSREVARRHLSFVAYSVPTDLPPAVTTQEALLEYLESLGFISTMTLPVRADMAGLPYLTSVIQREELERAIGFLKEYRASLDLETDGLVIKLSSLALQRDLGEGTRAPKWAAAYKFPPESKEALLLSIAPQLGRTGQITPVAKIEPVTLDGVVVQSVSLCNQDELDRLGIDIGDYVQVQRSGKVIPKIVGLARPSPSKSSPHQSFQLPKTCPCCATTLIRPQGMVHLYCPNPDCPDQVYARLVYALGKEALDIDGCGDITVRLLVEKAGVKKLSDLFALTEFGFIKGAAQRKLKEGIEAAKKAPLWRKLAALSIEEVGRVKCQDLATKFSQPVPADELQKEETAEKPEDQLNPILRMMNYSGQVERLIGASAKDQLINYLYDHIDELERLADHGFIFSADARSAGPLSGKTFCITGTLMSGKRDEVSALIEKLGGVVKGEVTKNVGFLIQGMGGGNKKAAGALKHGTRTITEEELYQMMGVPMPIMGKIE